MRRFLHGRAALLPLIAVAACTGGNKSTADDSTSSSGPKATSVAATGTASVSGARIADAPAGPPGEWQMPAGDYASSRYSELASITPPVSYTHLRAHETRHDLVCRLLLE